MSSGSTVRFNIPYPVPADNVNVQQDMQNLAESMENVLGDFEDEINAQTENVTTAINETIPELINELGLESLLTNGLTWGELKGNTL